MRTCIFTTELTYASPNMLKQVSVLLRSQLPSNRVLCAVNDHELLGFWFSEEVYYGVWGFEGVSFFIEVL